MERPGDEIGNPPILVVIADEVQHEDYGAAQKLRCGTYLTVVGLRGLHGADRSCTAADAPDRGASAPPLVRNNAPTWGGGVRSSGLPEWKPPLVPFGQKSGLFEFFQGPTSGNQRI